MPRRSDGSNLAGSPRLRRLSERAFRSSRPALRYPYINCTNCGPRYTVVLSLPYDRPNTTMQQLAVGRLLRSRISRSRQSPFSCAAGGLSRLRSGLPLAIGQHDYAWKRKHPRSGELLTKRQYLAVKGLGGYHLACDAGNAPSSHRFARTQISQRKAFRADGERSGDCSTI